MQRAIPMMFPNCAFVSIRQDIAKLNFKVTISFKLFLISINITSMERTIVYRVQNTDFYFTSTCSSWAYVFGNHKRKFSKDLHSNKQRRIWVNKVVASNSFSPKENKIMLVRSNITSSSKESSSIDPFPYRSND